MPRVGISTSEQTSGGSTFAIPEGNHEIVASIITNHTIPGYPGSCGYNVTAQPWAVDWSAPTSDEPISEFLACGPLTKFHPGSGSSSDDANPELEYGAGLDLGEEDDVQGNTLLSASGAGPDKKSKAAHLAASLEAAGVNPKLLNGFGPNLVGLRAHFTRLPLEKPKGSTAKEPPSALIIGFGGKQGGPEAVKQYPGQGQTAAPQTNNVPAPPTARRAKPVAAMAAVAAVAAPAATTTPTNGTATAVQTAGQPNWDQLKADLAGVTDSPTIAAALLDTLNDSSPGQSIPVGRLASKVITFFPKAGITDKTVQTSVQGLMKDTAWLAAQAKAFGWEFDQGAGVVKVVA